MREDIYRRLAHRLDTIPNGFPATASGVELKLLAKIFTPEEAQLAAVMRLTREPATEIAARAGSDPEKTHETLKAMARKGLIRAGRGEKQLAFGLLPFVVGIYEEQLPRMDEEMAALFEQYYQETRGGFVGGEVISVHRVIPVEESIPVEVEILPYERASTLIEQSKSWGVRDCICRVQQRLVGRGCDRPIENCIMLAPIEGAFAHSEATRPISKEEAKELVAQLQVSEKVRQRIRSRKRPVSNQDLESVTASEKKPGRLSPQITSELKAPRNGRAPRLEDLSTDRFSVTKNQLAMLVFRNVDRLLNSGGSLEEIRFELYKESTNFFKKRA